MTSDIRTVLEYRDGNLVEATKLVGEDASVKKYENGMYTEEEKEQIIVTYAADNMLKSKPTLSQAHRVRSVMQNYYFLKEGALEISDDGILTVNIEKMIPTAQNCFGDEYSVHKEYYNN